MTRRPRRHWKHSRYVSTDEFVWSKPCTWHGVAHLPGDPVDKELAGEKKLRRLHKARFIEAVFTAPVIKDPLAPALAPVEVATLPAKPKKRRTRKAELASAAA